MEGHTSSIWDVGDNMRDVAVTEGDKVEAEVKFGWEIDAYNITDVAEYVHSAPNPYPSAIMRCIARPGSCFSPESIWKFVTTA